MGHGFQSKTLIVKMTTPKATKQANVLNINIQLLSFSLDM